MIWDFENILSRRLVLWASLSILIGSVMALSGDRFWQSFGIQFLAWGVVDGVIGWIGIHRKKNLLKKLTSFQDEEKEGDRIRKLLWVNAALDVVYVACGAAVIYFLGSESIFWRGSGWGVIVQGSFLYVFDLLHALRVPSPLQLPHLPLFTHSDHEPFIFEGGTPAAILIHGFPGTPLEMRPLGRKLQEAGWTVYGIRLPGFGPELDQLLTYQNKDWVNAVLKACQNLEAKGHTPLLLVGFSFGGSLALQAAARQNLDGLVLIAPITWRETPCIKCLVDFARVLLPVSVRPFQRINLENPLLTQEYQNYLPEIDLADPDQLNELRLAEIPLGVLDQIREVSSKGLQAAQKLHIPTLLIQGSQDKVIRPNWTEYLRTQMHAHLTFVKVDGQHSLTMPHNPAFDEVATKTITFAAQLIQSHWDD